MPRRTIMTSLLAAAAGLAPAAAQADVRITEFMYQGVGNGAREFVELTNIDTAAVDVSSWSYNDNNFGDLGVAFGAAFGMLAANESIILTELDPTVFRTQWSLAASVRVFSIGGNSNLSSTDTVNIFNSATIQTAATLVDSVLVSGSTEGISRNRPNAIGTVPNTAFVNAAAGDAYGSVLSTAGDRGNPGRFPFPAAGAVPEPATWAMLIGGFGFIGGTMRRRARGLLAPTRA